MTSWHRRTAAFAVVATMLAIVVGTITAAPAKADAESVETTLTVTADPADPGSALLRAEMVGPYIQAGGAIPAGTWSFTVADDSGTTLFARDVARPDDGPTAVDVVWPDVPAGVAASAIVTYLPSEPSETVEFAGATASFISTEAAEATDVRLSQAAPTQPQQGEDPFTFGLGILVAASLLVAAVGILLLVRRDRRAAGGRP